MGTPTAEQLRDPNFAKSLLDAICAQPFEPGRTFIDLLRRRPKFRRMREIHGARARKLRRRWEYVHFLRWECGHCVYGWGGPVPETFTFRMPHPATRRPEPTRIDYRTVLLVRRSDQHPPYRNEPSLASGCPERGRSLLRGVCARR